MEEIIINESNNSLYKYVIFSVSSDSPLFFLEDINSAIKLKNGQKILFDQLLQTGDNYNRFLCLTFLNNKIDLSSICHVEKQSLDKDLFQFISNYLRQEQLILKHSILLEKQKKIILSGGNI